MPAPPTTVPILKQRLRGCAATLLLLGATPAPADEDDRMASAREDIARYQAGIEQTRAERGPRAVELTEHYVGLGFAQRRAGDHAGAAASLREAVFLERIHQGLEHPAQIALIERLVESLVAAGDDAAAARYVTLLAWTNERARTTTDPAWQATAERTVRWYLELAQRGGGRDSYEHLERAVALSERVVTNLESNNHADNQASEAASDQAGNRASAALQRWLTLKAAASFAAASYIAELNLEAVRFVSGRNFTTGDPVSDDDLIYRQHLITRYYVGGRKALEQSLALARAAGDAQATARAVRYLGDWHLLFGRRQTADALYAEASQLAADSQPALFAQPRRLPDFGLNDTVGTATNAQPPARFVRTRFDIDARGRPHNIEILETRPAGAHGLARRVRQRLSRTRYRPRYTGGGAVETSDIEVRFVFPVEGTTKGARS